MKNVESFGGNWTIEKLDIIFKYLSFYTTALQNTKYKKIYVDGFAGEGTVELKNGAIINGSAAMSLNINIPFDRYIFIEINRKKVKKLGALKNEYKNRNIDIICNDANESLRSIVNDINWKYTRGVFFVDPFATQTEWETLKCIANTKSADLWFLFPFSAINRLFAKDKNQTMMWKQRLNNCFGGNDWEDAIYKQKKKVQLSLFEGEEYESNLEKVSTDILIEYIKNKLTSIFPYVSPNPKIFKNEKNSILFILFFMTANPDQKAIKLASKCAEYILGKKKQ